MEIDDGTYYGRDGSQDVLKEENFGLTRTLLVPVKRHARKELWQMCLQEMLEEIGQETPEVTEESLKTLEQIQELQRQRRHNCERYGTNWPNF
jgi:hypothetical protein